MNWIVEPQKPDSQGDQSFDFFWRTIIEAVLIVASCYGGEWLCQRLKINHCD